MIASSARLGPRELFALVSWAALVLFRLGRFALGVFGLWIEVGAFWALAAAAFSLATQLWLPLRIGVFIAAVALWHWPWIAALALAAPRALLILPGLIAYGLARLRHPRARWPVEWTSADAATVESGP
jgi:hypothetical protein